MTMEYIWSASAVASAMSFLGYPLLSRQRGCIPCTQKEEDI
jgi:hypothetical protein